MEILLGAIVFVVAVSLALSIRYQRTAYARAVAEQRVTQEQLLAIAAESNIQQREMIVEIIAIRNSLQRS